MNTTLLVFYEQIILDLIQWFIVCTIYFSDQLEEVPYYHIPNNIY